MSKVSFIYEIFVYRKGNFQIFKIVSPSVISFGCSFVAFVVAEK